MKKSFGLRATALGASSLILLAGCAAPEPGAASPSPAGTTIEVKDLWLKATQDDMSSAFGTIENTGDRAVTITQVSSAVSGDTGLHETVANESGAMVMREKTGGFTIEAHGKLELAPGANHLMIMDPKKPLKAGDEVALTLEFSDESSFDFTAPVKDFAGAKESYDESSSQSGHGH
ncbi:MULTISPECIES: copper chaperone PCu(A)C [Glutamicibacter]|uniref:Copper chaperone PCu(A)C n=2 Tax=Glutamicibacter halophytocola TaxID=1933880 RepID=A0AA95BR34_9MICC|nr:MULTISPECIES: copper chaperone PCu(A)C [Glutamicibacter]UUX58844.1 copper chaperone PCu(A)C [Glutamicibacter halophytocola]